MNAQFLTANERKRLLAEIERLYGIESLPYLFIETNKERIRVFSGSLTKEEIMELDEMSRIELIGTYFAKPEYGFRLSFDVTHLFQSQITKGIVDLDVHQAKEWMRGNGLPLVVEKGIHVMRFKDDFLGCGYSDGEKLWNFVPKERRSRK